VRKCILAAIAGLVGFTTLGARPLAAQNTHQDPLGRFAIDLPAGFKLQTEQLDRIYVFERSATRIMLVVVTDVSDRDAVWANAVESFTGKTVQPPPDGTVFDMDVNGNPARLAQYTFDVDNNGKSIRVTGKLGVVMLEGTETGLGYLALLNEKDVKQYGEATVQAFNSIRLPGAPMTGASAPVAAVVKPPAPAAGQEIAIPTAAAAPQAPASTFQHPLVTLSIPAGWTATAGEGAQIAEIAHPDYLSLRVVGLEKNKFGKNRDEILKALVQGLQSQIPSFNQTKPPYEIPLDAGGSALAAEYEGTIVAAGQSMPHRGLVVAMKDSRRGIGFMWVATPSDWDAGLEQVLAIVKSLR
jgi:hypothetical protein